MNSIKLNDILKLDNLSNTKIRFNLMFDGNWNPIEMFKNNEMDTILGGHYWNYNKMKSYKNGQITVGFIRIKNNENLWLLFHIGKITKDLNIQNGIGYEYEALTEYEKYLIKNNTSAILYEANISKEYKRKLLFDMISGGVNPSLPMVNLKYNEINQKRSIELIDLNN